MSTVWTPDLLDALRQIGDPPLDDSDGEKARWRLVNTKPADQDFQGHEDISLLQTWRRSEHGALPAEVDPSDWYWTIGPVAPVDTQLALAQELFVLNGGEIAAALLMAALPATYAAHTGAEVLAHTGELESNARRRIAETAQLTVDVLFPDDSDLYEVAKPPPKSSSRSLLPGGHGYARVLSTRLTHAVIRDVISSSGSWDPNSESELRHSKVKRGVPVNQEDLLGVLGTFTISVIDAVEKLGVTWSPEAQQAYVDLWDRVGALLGIGGKAVTDRLRDDYEISVPFAYNGRLRPRTVKEFRGLVDLIIERSWPIPRPGPHPPPFESVKGKVLVRALLDELQEAMPRGMERLPLVVMRHLVRPEAQELLGLGGGGLLEAMAQLSRQLGGRHSPVRLGEKVIDNGMRMLANEVSRRAFVHFIRTRAKDNDASNFWFPPISEYVGMRPTRTSS